MSVLILALVLVKSTGITLLAVDWSNLFKLPVIPLLTALDVFDNDTVDTELAVI